MSVQSGRRPRAPRGSGEQLRDEIIDAASELLCETDDAKAVSIRSVSQRVGVTPPSIYLHFTDKEAMLHAVCCRYFDKLHEQMLAVEDAGRGGMPGVDVLRAQGVAYVRFAMQNPELYRIATMGHGRPGSDVDVTLNSSAFSHIRNSVQSLIDDGTFPPGDATAIALQLFAAAHGVAALLISRPYLPWGDVDEFADRVLRSVCLGHIVSTAILPADTTTQTVDWLREVADERRRSR